jgi:hypothetical protein
MMFAIKNTRTGELASKRSNYMFYPVNGKRAPLLYMREADAKLTLASMNHNLAWTAHKGLIKDGDKLEVVKVGLIEITPQDELPLEDIPIEWK